MQNQFQVKSIGQVLRENGKTKVHLLPDYRDGLLRLNEFSHVLVFWWADRCDNEQDRSKLQTQLPYAEDKTAGVFACRAEYRPNPIAMSVCPIVHIDNETGQIEVANIDAVDNTRVLDLKPYFPVCDRVKNVYIPKWLEGWPEWMPEEGIAPM